MNNNELISALQRGEEAAFDRLFEKYYDGLFKYAAAITRNNEDAREIVNDTFFRVFLSIEKLKNYECFTGWLFKIARNLCYDRINKRKREAETYSEAAAAEIKTGYHPGSNLDEMLSTLKPVQKDIVILREICGYSYKEISAFTGKSITALKAIHHRALIGLRKLLAGNEMEEARNE